VPAPFVYQAPASCPSESDFRQRVAGWLDSADALANGRLHVEAQPRQGGDRTFAGQATLPRSGAVRDLHAASCDELVTAFAFVFAVDLDERVLERARPEPPPPPPLPPLTAAEREAPRPPRAPLLPPTPLGPRHVSLSLAALTGVGGGVLPHATPLEGLEVEARSARDGEAGLFFSPRLRLGGAFDTPASASSADMNGGPAGGTFLALRVHLDACPLALGGSIVDVSICARAETSLLFASGSGFPGARSATDVLVGIGGAARVSFRLSPRWALGVDGGLVPPFGPDRFTAEDGSSRLYTTSALTGSAQAFVAFRFR
jgi:hypothetical protein